MSTSSGNNLNRSSETMISLQWSHFESFILKGIASMFTSIEEFADVTLVCGDGRSFKAHKVVLSIWSPYFRAIFLNNICDHPVIILRDFKSEDIEVILHFIYQGQALLHPENEIRILETAVSLQIAGFEQMKEPTEITGISSSTPTRMGAQNMSNKTSTPLGGTEQHLLLQKAPQQRHTIIGISPIAPITIQSEDNKKLIVEKPSPTLTPKIISSTTMATPVYKPHKRQKVETTPTKNIISTSVPSKISKVTTITENKDVGQENLTTMYSMDQQRIIITEQEIPRCSSSSSQELEFIEIINISPDQNSVTLNLATELESAPPLEPVETESSFVFRSPSPTDYVQTHRHTETPGTSTNHRTIIIKEQKLQDTTTGNHSNEKNLNNQKIMKEDYEFVPCPKCGKNVKETSLRVHISRTHLEEGTILICPICSKVIHSKGVYYKHMFLHRKKDQKSAVKQQQPVPH